ncbi:MAG: competence/damage-inducible protein A [Flavisolibacter sp.]
MKNIEASIITIGDELLIGQTIDTNSAFIAQELNSIGIWVKRRIAVGDLTEEILKALQQESEDADLIIITGGLGPTADDITKPALCSYFNSKLVTNEEALQNVKDIFIKLNRPLIERNLQQAEVPDNCIVLPNRRGTAPGMWFEKEKVIYVSLPGVPNEMKGLMVDRVIPKLKETLQLPFVVHRTLLTSGIGESAIAEIISDFENSLPSHIKLAYLPAYGMVRLRLTARSADAHAENEVSTLFEKLKFLVTDWMVADEDIKLEQAISKLLKEKGKKLSTAESCTGGFIAHLITSHAGSSEIFNGSIVAYANNVKKDILGVQATTLESYGAVSEETVTEMATAVLKKLNTDYSIATSGIMGPGGGSKEKPAGTVWIAVANQHQVKASKHFFRFNRDRNIELTANTALTLLYRFIKEQEAD